MQLGNSTNATGLPLGAELYSELANSTSSFLLDATRIALGTAELAHKKLDDLTASNVVRGAAVATASVSMCVFCVACAVCSCLKSFRRRKANRLMVQIAEEAPVDDRDEHEFEQHMDPRLPAPGDSDAEEAEDGTAATAGPKDRLTGQGSRTA
jgi:hypothetical protein